MTLDGIDLKTLNMKYKSDSFWFTFDEHIRPGTYDRKRTLCDIHIKIYF